MPFRPAAAREFLPRGAVAREQRHTDREARVREGHRPGPHAVRASGEPMGECNADLGALAGERSAEGTVVRKSAHCFSDDITLLACVLGVLPGCVSACVWKNRAEAAKISG